MFHSVSEIYVFFVGVKFFRLMSSQFTNIVYWVLAAFLFQDGDAVSDDTRPAWPKSKYPP